MDVVVPFGAAEPKTRLAPVLDADERRDFAAVMLADVLETLVEAGSEPTVLADDPVDIGALADSTDDGAGLAEDDDEAGTRGALPDAVIDAVSVTVDERPLTDAVDARLPDDADDDPVAVVMADLALATPTAIDRLFEPDADVTLVPGRGGGTNAVVARDPAFRVDYHGASILDHRAVAADADLSVATVDSFRLATDVDRPADLVEVLLHAEGRSARWLRDRGFEIVEPDGRVDVDR